MFKKGFSNLIKLVKQEYKFILLLLFTYIICICPVNYYIITSGGISDIDSRIEVADGYDSKGSFNISYVSELKGTVSTYLFSYLIPDWKRVNTSNYKYNDDEDYADIEFRSDLDLDVANSTAIKWAYNLANKKYDCIDTKIYVIATFSEYKTNLEVQDEIISINKEKFNTIKEYQDYMQQIDSKTVDILVRRNNKEKLLKNKVYQEDNRKILGVGLEALNTFKTTPNIKIKFKKSESGPSGGLITTLDIYNKLTKKDLTKGLKIAGTGTIEEDGSIGTIGEVKYKLLGAVKDKADIFLVPSGENYQECVKVKKEKKLKIKLIEVKNIKEAIEKLKKIEV